MDDETIEQEPLQMRRKRAAPANRKEYFAAYHRQRYASDPEHRERRRTYARNWKAAQRAKRKAK